MKFTLSESDVVNLIVLGLKATMFKTMPNLEMNVEMLRSARGSGNDGATLELPSLSFADLAHAMSAMGTGVQVDKGEPLQKGVNSSLKGIKQADKAITVKADKVEPNIATQASNVEPVIPDAEAAPFETGETVIGDSVVAETAVVEPEPEQQNTRETETRVVEPVQGGVKPNIFQRNFAK